MMHYPIKIAVLVQDLEFGGTQRYAIHLLKRLDRELFSPELWVLRGGEEMVPAARDAGIPIVWMSKSSWATSWALSRLMWKLIKHRPDLLYTLTVLPNIYGRVFAAAVGVPAIVSGYRNAVAKQLEKWLWPLSTRIICNAEAMKAILVERFSVDPSRISVIPNAVDTDFFSPDESLKDLQPTILFAGRLVEQKDPFSLLEAMKFVVRQIPSVRLLMMGDGHLRPELNAFVQDNGLHDHVTVMPGTRDIRAYLRRAWVFALPSIFEGSPNVILEAMATGLPVVATRVDGVPEIVSDRETGLLVEPRNPQALARALTDVLNNDSQRRSMSIAARERVLALHNVDDMVKHTEQVFLDAIREHVSMAGKNA